MTLDLYLLGRPQLASAEDGGLNKRLRKRRIFYCCSIVRGKWKGNGMCGFEQFFIIKNADPQKNSRIAFSENLTTV